MGGSIRVLYDGLRNVVANLGTSRDKASATSYGAPTLTLDQALAAYRATWLARKIVDVPAMDAIRNWRSWIAEADQISKIEAEETRLGVKGKLRDALIKARLMGGAAIYIGTGEQDPTKPLRPESISTGGIRHLTVMSRHVLTANDIDRDAESPNYGKPVSYQLSGASSQVTIHPSRLVVLQGAKLPDADLTPAIDGWGDSVLTAVFDELRRADSTSANIASLIFEAKVDVISIPNLMANLMDPAFEQLLLNRLSLAMTAKGINGTLILDKDEEYQSKQAQFANLRDILMAFFQLVSGAADIPMTRLLGQSPAGLNSTGDGDLHNYYDHIRSMQELDIQPELAVLDECLVRSALGARPPEVHYNWRSLWQSTEKERADIGKITAETIKTISETNLIPEDVMSKVAVNMLTEAGVAPGLEAEMEDYSGPSAEERAAQRDQEERERRAAALAIPQNDAKPRPLYVHRKVLNAGEIFDWAKSQGFESTLPAEDLHVTIVFSRAPVDWLALGEAWNTKDDGTLVVKPGGPRVIERFGGGATVLVFASVELQWRHQSIKEAGASWDWPEYQPHITLTYSGEGLDLEKIEPYRGAIVLGPEVFEELDEDWKSKVREN